MIKMAKRKNGASNDKTIWFFKSNESPGEENGANRTEKPLNRR